ncbi:MAG: HAMP domain-containing histidine kinase [Chloroflexales bacterium]|nr:HAMP domain-containing histidine kinase [Chloroflexales bacterium]
MRMGLRNVALRTSALYGLAGILWILLSDRLLAAIVNDPGAISSLQTFKGWAFVAVTMALLYIILHQQLRRWDLEANARQQAEEQLRVLNAELELRVAARTAELAEANTRLGELNALKDHLLAITSHDLRSPLGIIMNTVELIWQDPNLPERVRQMARRIDSVAQQMLHLVVQLLDLSRLQSGQLTLERSPTYTSVVAHQVLDALQGRAHDKAITTELLVAPGELPLEADATKLFQIIHNLLSNAIKFTPSGGYVTLTVVAEPRGVRVSVSDTGLGIPPEALPHLFEKFRQVHTRGTANEPGSGLGLAIVRQLVELHGGSVEVVSEPQRGSTFTVHLPTAP